MAGTDLKKPALPKPIDLNEVAIGGPGMGAPPPPPWKDSDQRMYRGLNLLQNMAQGALDIPQDALDAYQAWTKFGTVEKANEYLDDKAFALKKAVLRGKSPKELNAMTEGDHRQMFWDMRPNSLVGDKEYWDREKEWQTDLPPNNPPILRNKRYQFLPEKLSRKLEYDTPWHGSPLGKAYGPPGLGVGPFR